MRFNCCLKNVINWVPDLHKGLFFEKNNFLFQLPVTKSEGEKKTYINNFLQNEGVKVSESTINLLTNNLSNQRLEIKSELEENNCPTESTQKKIYAQLFFFFNRIT